MTLTWHFAFYAVIFLKRKLLKRKIAIKILNANLKNTCKSAQLRISKFANSMRKRQALVLPNSLRWMGMWRNSTETQQTGHTPRPRPYVRLSSTSAQVCFYNTALIITVKDADIENSRLELRSNSSERMV